jgi:hypothetical protein
LLAHGTKRSSKPAGDRKQPPRDMTLEPGDRSTTGTLSGFGMGVKPSLV